MVIGRQIGGALKIFPEIKRTIVPVMGTSLYAICRRSYLNNNRIVDHKTDSFVLLQNKKDIFFPEITITDLFI